MNRRRLLVAAVTVATAAGVTLLAAAPTPATVAAPATVATTARTTKLLIVVEENHARSQTRSTGTMPYLDSLADQYGEATQVTALAHPSLGNYVGLAFGDSHGITDDAGPLYHRIAGPTVMDQAQALGKRGRSYHESMPSKCYPTDYGTASYIVHHNPWAYASDAASHQGCTSYDSPMTYFNSLTANGYLPNVALVVPTNLHNGHNGTLTQADDWLRALMTKVLAGPDWQSGRLAVIVTWDEPPGSHPLSEPVETVIVSPHATGADYAVPANLYSLTRYADSVLGAPPLAKASTATDLTAWVPVTGGP